MHIVDPQSVCLFVYVCVCGVCACVCLLVLEMDEMDVKKIVRKPSLE